MPKRIAVSALFLFSQRLKASRHRELLPVILIVAVILLASVSLYAWGYISLGDKFMSVDGRFVIRAYRSKPMAVFFRPAARIEGFIGGYSFSTEAVAR